MSNAPSASDLCGRADEGGVQAADHVTDERHQSDAGHLASVAPARLTVYNCCTIALYYANRIESLVRGGDVADGARDVKSCN